MVAIPVVKLGSLVLKTLSKPIASRLKQQAGIHPKFRNFIINIAQVAGAAVIFEVQRSARSEGRKEELRKQELEAIKQRSEDLAREVDLLKNKLDELEHHAKGRGLAGILNLGKTHASEAGKSTAAA